jgi:alkanesulfonate monooxygenase SsuD/methylene tetrahydromethanopterin reductase-like flavin-dependent oxidoreductase (luciferase family)
MHFGHFSLMGYREKGYPTQRIMAEHAEQVRLADQAGFECAWFAEHHFSNYCTCPSPLLMVAHCAGITERIKLGTAIVVTPLYEPSRLLAEIGMTDALTGGRLVLGVGSGYQPYEFERFGVDIAKNQEMMAEFLEIMELAFTRTTFTYEGKHYRYPETQISARPVDGVPEIWVAGDNPKGHALAARNGYVPMFTGRWGGAAYIGEMATKVRDGFAKEGKDPTSVPIGVQRFLCITESRAESLDYIDNARHQMRLASALRRRAEVMNDGMMTEVPLPNEITVEQMADNLLVGDAETVAERLAAEIRAANPHHVMFHVQVGGSRQDQALRTIETFATDVRPMLEKELGPLDAIGAEPRPRMAAA